MVSEFKPSVSFAALLMLTYAFVESRPVDTTALTLGVNDPVTTHTRAHMALSKSRKWFHDIQSASVSYMWCGVTNTGLSNLDTRPSLIFMGCQWERQ